MFHLLSSKLIHIYYKHIWGWYWCIDSRSLSTYFLYLILNSLTTRVKEIEISQHLLRKRSWVNFFFRDVGMGNFTCFFESILSTFDFGVDKAINNFFNELNCLIISGGIRSDWRHMYWESGRSEERYIYVGCQKCSTWNQVLIKLSSSRFWWFP